MITMRVCVYCASSARIDRAYFEATDRLARAFVQEGIEVVYGGGASGLMGQLADSVLEAGGSIKGIMPRFMNEVEWAHKQVADLELTETMHERKARFLVDVDALVALPGGSSTLEELLEAITLKRLGQFTKPIIILNINNYYDPLKAMLEQCIRERFMDERHRNMYTFVYEPEAVIVAIRQAKTWDEGAIDFAVNR